MDSQRDICQLLLKKAIQKGHNITHKVEGKSMLPTIKPGQTITLSHTLPKKLTIGEIVVFQSLKTNVVHRLVKIIKKENEVYITKGDNNLACDPPTETSKILGRVEKIDGTKLSSLESQEQRNLLVMQSLRQDKVGRRILFLLTPLRKVKIALVGHKNLGVVRFLVKLTRFI